MHSGGLPTGLHGDVLSANPTDEEGKQKLVDEIKGRAKSILGTTKNYKEALELYNKAIEVIPNDAILYSNRSMCNLAMHYSHAALSDADKAIELDGSYAKGYYRRAMAQLELKQYAAAHDALQENLKLAPSDKGVQAQITKVISIMDGEGASPSTEAVPKARNTVSLATNSKTSPPPPPSVAPSTPSTSTSNPKPKPKTKATSTEVETGDASDAVGPSGTSSMKGYKITADGRKTSYFTNVLDEQTKELIGDIRPKKIESTSNAAPVAGNTAGSAWNTAGTFEERNVTPWCKECVEGALSDVKLNLERVFPHPAVSGSQSADTPLAHLDLAVVISKVKSVTGDASTIVNRGKKKYIYDFAAECEWRLEGKLHGISDSKPIISVTGTMSISDIMPGDEPEFSIVVGKPTNKSDGCITDSEVVGLVTKYIRKSGHDTLQALVKQALKRFEEQFKLEK